MISNILLALIGLSAGAVVSAGTFAFISAIGIVPRMAQRTQTEKYIRFYEDIILLGGVFGTTTMFVNYRLPPIKLLAGGYALATGIFIGVLALSLTEVLNVMPILMRRTRMKMGLPWLLLAFALGKVAGAAIYFFIDGFYVL